MRAPPIKRHDAQAIILTLPMPPSTNALWRSSNGRVHRSRSYKAWARDAGWQLVQQRLGCVRGPYMLSIRVCRQETKMDLGNAEKCVSDLLQEHGIVENDKLAERIELEWGAQTGIVVSIVSTQERAAA